MQIVIVIDHCLEFTKAYNLTVAVRTIVHSLYHYINCTLCILTSIYTVIYYKYGLLRFPESRVS